MASLMPSSSTRLACSMVSTPPRIAALMPSAPCAWAATFMPARCASADPPAGGADLDHLGAVLVHLAHPAAALVGAVDHRVALLVHGRREGIGVAVAAGRADGGA